MNRGNRRETEYIHDDDDAGVFVVPAGRTRGPWSIFHLVVAVFVVDILRQIAQHKQAKTCAFILRGVQCARKRNFLCLN